MTRYKAPPSIKNAQKDVEKSMIEKWKKEDIQDHNQQIDNDRSSFNTIWFWICSFLLVVVLGVLLFRFNHFGLLW
jgi:hypothetical protein